MTASQSIAPLPIELWDIIIRLSVPPSGLGRGIEYPWIDSHRRREQDRELHKQRNFSINRLSQVCWPWRELLSTVRNQDLRITRAGRLSLTLLLEEYDRNPRLFKETQRIRVHFPIKEAISFLISFVQGISSLTTLELIIDNVVDASGLFKPLRDHLPAILDATPSLIRLDIEDPIEFDPIGVLSTDMIGRFSDAGRHLRCLSCSIGFDYPYALNNAPSFPHLEILRIAIRCDWSGHGTNEWFKRWELPLVKQLSFHGYTPWPAYGVNLDLLLDNNIPNLEVLDIRDQGQISLSEYWRSCPKIRILISSRLGHQILSVDHRMSELVWIETPDDDYTCHSYEEIVQDILEYVQGEVVRVNPPDNRLIFRVPDLLWGEVRNLSRQRRKDFYEIALELNQICQSHNISLVDGEGQEINAYLSSLMDVSSLSGRA